MTVFGVLLAVAVIAFGVGVARGDIEYRSWGTHGYRGVFLATLAGSATLFFPAPNIPVIVAGSLTLNPLFVGILGGAGWGLGEASGYLVGRYFFSLIVRFFFRKRKWLQKFQAATRELEKKGLLAVFILALFPNPGFDFVGLAAGYMKLGLGRFILACMSAKILTGILIAYLSSGTRPLVH